MAWRMRRLALLSVPVNRLQLLFIVRPLYCNSSSNLVSEKSHASTNHSTTDSAYEESNAYTHAYRRSLEDPANFWSEVAHGVTWMKPWSRVFDDSRPPFTRWFVGGETNACFNAVDRHVENGKGQVTALLHDSPVTGTQRRLTYAELQQQVRKLAGWLSSVGVSKGDRVLIYMPMVPEAVVAMLASARIGAVHSLVFGGFAARELATRIRHAEPKVIISASCGVEPSRLIHYKPILDEAISLAGATPTKCLIFQREESGLVQAELMSGRDVTWQDVMAANHSHDCVPLEANDPLYVLYTSGTTGDPKGIVRPTGGHIVNLNWTMDTIYAMKPGQVWWAASDLGWVVGHSYICYAPLLRGLTSIIYEGKPVGTPDAGQYFRVVAEHKVEGMFTAPTALRAIRREDPELIYGKRHDISTLRYIFVAGEHCDYETREWAELNLNVPVLDHWWQTETGSAMTATCVGLKHNLCPPRDTGGKPVPGYDIRVLGLDHQPVQPGELGRIVVKMPLPPGSMSTLFKADDRFKEIYFKNYPGFYDTMDAGMIDKAGYMYIMSRDDDVINVAGHRLSTSALEEALLEHPEISEAAVVGVPDVMKGEVPLGLFVPTKNCKTPALQLSAEAVSLVRKLVGPVAAFKLAAPVLALPKTRSGKIARKSIADLARNKAITLPPTIEDPAVYKEIKQVLKSLGYAKTAPDPIF